MKIQGQSPLSSPLSAQVQAAQVQGPNLSAQVPSPVDVAGPSAVQAANTAPAALSGGVVRWNDLARELVARTRTAPPHASRGYALLSLAQREVLAEAAARKLPAAEALAEASRGVLSALFPAEAAAIDARAKQEAPRGRRSVMGSPAEAARSLGKRVAEQILAARENDGAKAAWTGQLQQGAGHWYPEPGQTAAVPQWSDVTPFAIPAKGAPGRPTVPPPPAFGSPAFQAALAEVRQISDTRTPAQLANAMFWADNAGTSTPPGHWNQIAADLVRGAGLPDTQAAEVLATLNVALADAAIACWEVKYRDGMCRPWQADPAITVPADLGKPNHPSYVSGHATFSGAAAAVLGHYFPAKATELAKMADQAAWSRVEGGIHYAFDGTKGLELGRQVAAHALGRAGAEGAARG